MTDPSKALRSGFDTNNWLVELEKQFQKTFKEFQEKLFTESVRSFTRRRHENWLETRSQAHQSSCLSENLSMG
jgi:hypothetical protein